ncbi:hypothetical protein VB711_12570 [Cronbergia sp. UHCC 0137]|nr:hypothetical protein [Cronbergia sp. UHCC 0137]MEA5618665.1 hypothetical protein [Cronbergia sp. UHCC 0137]
MTRSGENNFIADIPNAQLRLPSGEAFTFRSEKSVEGIREITVNYRLMESKLRFIHTKTSELTYIWLMKSQNNVLLRHTHLD